MIRIFAPYLLALAALWPATTGADASADDTRADWRARLNAARTRQIERL